MITEDYCSYEVAKLLKEKGFNEPCRAYWDDQPKLDVHTLFFSVEPIRNSKLVVNDVSCPTHQMAMKWLRKVHHYYIQIMLDSWALGDHSGYYVVIQKTDSDFEMMLQDAIDDVFYQTYEEAVEAALKYSLENLI